MDNRAGITITRGQLEAWARRTLTDAEVSRIDDAIPLSSIPDAVNEIAAAMQND